MQMGAALHRTMADGADGAGRRNAGERSRGTPQGGVVSPKLSNLFMHYAFDLWIRGRTPTSHGVGMRMMGWYTAGTSRKRRPSRPNFKPAWQSAAWRCIRRKPRSSTARMGSAGAGIRTSSSTSSDIAFGRDWLGVPGQHIVLGLQPGGQRLGAESHAVDDPGIEHPTSNADVAGRDRTADQSTPAGVDRILRAIRALGTGAFAPIRQSNASGLGDAEVQALRGHKVRASRFLQRMAQEQRASSYIGGLGMTGTFA